MRSVLAPVAVSFLCACSTVTAPAPGVPSLAGSYHADLAAVTPGASTVGTAAVTPAAPMLLGGGKGSSTRFKVGPFFPSGDISDLDDGVWGELVFSKEIIALLAIEGSVGYFSTDGQSSGTQVDLWGIPLFLNGRLQVPILILEAYGGLGIGGVYADYEAGGFSNDDFVVAWDAFLGLEVGLGGWGIGAEVKYLQTEDTKDDFAIEGTSAMLFVALGF